MLTEKEAKKIGIRACIEKLGSEFCKEYANSATSCWGMEDDNTMYCYVGVSTDPEPDYDLDKVTELTLDAKGKFPYSANCLVNMENGNITFLQLIKNGKIIEDNKERK